MYFIDVIYIKAPKYFHYVSVIRIYKTLSEVLEAIEASQSKSLPTPDLIVYLP